jgi:RHH-type proline utilization regulon transcriptional repressor/proline dehydrogenase/delta 1-pyrroline-5-carboxylate dehydrogenase
LALDELYGAMSSQLNRPSWSAVPIVDGRELAGSSRMVFDPSDRTRPIGSVADADGVAIESALVATHSFAAQWDSAPVATRAAIIERTADLLEERKAELMALCVREAGKTLPDALSEVREAIDLLRYYAGESKRLFAAPLELPGPTGERNTLELHGRGVFVCISPWNFAGDLSRQIGAARWRQHRDCQTAEQTPLIGCAAVRILLEAGLPAAAIALLPGTGETVGAALVADDRIAGVCFTGSLATAKLIQRALAARNGAIVPLIAETGGLNALIADSSALPEQLVQDVLASAFNSAGQRCSALRALFVQEDSAPRVIRLLAGALETLHVGDPIELATDIGPVIDEVALAQLQSHEQKLARDGKLIGKTSLPKSLASGLFFAPVAYEIASFDWLEAEVFGPILHVVRYRRPSWSGSLR